MYQQNIIKTYTKNFNNVLYDTIILTIMVTNNFNSKDPHFDNFNIGEKILFYLLTLFRGTCISAAVVGVRYIYYKYKIAEQSGIVSAQKDQLFRKYCEDLQARLDLDNLLENLLNNTNTIQPSIVPQHNNMY